LHAKVTRTLKKNMFI